MYGYVEYFRPSPVFSADSFANSGVKFLRDDGINEKREL